MGNLHLVNHIKHPHLQSDSTLHVIGVVSNPVRWHSRMRLFKEWKNRMLQTPNVRLYVVEGLYGDRHPECAPEPGESYEFMTVKLNSEMWLKENMINIGVENMFPSDWKYMCWCDCDVEFLDNGWALGAIQQLQHYNIIQPWSHALDLDFHGGVHQTFKSFGFLCATHKPMHHGNNPAGAYDYAHTGYVWACNRYFWENVKGLVDWCIIGSGDHHMAWSCVGKIEETIHSKVNDDYKLACRLWQDKAKWAAAGIVGYLHGTIKHGFHGHKVNRKYWDRWNIILKHNYSPTKDLAYDAQGVLQFIGAAKPEIDQLFMRYNRERAEDAV